MARENEKKSARPDQISAQIWSKTNTAVVAVAQATGSTKVEVIAAAVDLFAAQPLLWQLWALGKLPTDELEKIVGKATLRRVRALFEGRAEKEGGVAG